MWGNAGWTVVVVPAFWYRWYVKSKQLLRFYAACVPGCLSGTGHIFIYTYIYIYPELGRDVFVSVPVWWCLVLRRREPCIYRVYMGGCVWVNVPSSPPLCIWSAAWHLQCFSCECWLLIEKQCRRSTVSIIWCSNMWWCGILRRNNDVASFEFDQNKKQVTAAVKSGVFFAAGVVLFSCSSPFFFF